MINSGRAPINTNTNKYNNNVIVSYYRSFMFTLS